jgi:hypothetical protein
LETVETNGVAEQAKCNNEVRLYLLENVNLNRFHIRVKSKDERVECKDAVWRVPDGNLLPFLFSLLSCEVITSPQC